MEDDQRVQPRPEPENMNLMKHRGPNVHEPRTKTILRITLKPDKVDLIDRH
jgi:hypothetical protein